MKKVLAIAPYSYLPYYSGGQKFIARFFEWLAKETDLAVVTVAENDFSKVTNYKTLPLLKKGFSRYYDRSLYSKIKGLITTHGFDTIIWEHPYYGWLAKKIQKKTGIHTILHTHNIEYQRFRSTGRWWWPVLRSYEKSFFKNADQILFISPQDKAFAIENWKISRGKCIDLPFGVDIAHYPADRAQCREMIGRRHGIDKDEKILFFNGLLNYKPNLDALKIILNEVNPFLRSTPGWKYKIIICGKGLPPEMNDLNEYKEQNIIYAGYTDQISEYYKAADLLINPVLSGGGVKTKIIEAIGYGCGVVSTLTGALGTEPAVCGVKLAMSEDGNWKHFSAHILMLVNDQPETPDSFYQYYYWGNVMKRFVLPLPDHPTR